MEKKLDWNFGGNQNNEFGYLTQNPPFTNGFGSTPTPTPIFDGVNIDEISTLFSPTLKPEMPGSVKLLTMTGSAVYIPNEVLNVGNVALILTVKSQIENSIFKPENNSVLDLVYTPEVNGSIPENYYIGYGLPTNDALAVNAMMHAASRLVVIFKDFGIDLTSDRVTAKMAGSLLRDIFISAYVISMQIIIMYNTKRDNEKAEKLRNIQPPVEDYTAGNDMINKNEFMHLRNSKVDEIFGMPVTESNFETEHKSIFDGVKLDKNGMFNIEFGKDSDKLTEIIDKASDYELVDNKKEVKKNE